MDKLDKKPDLSQSFPNQMDDLKINNDLNNRVHGPHFDILQSIEGGADQIRVNSQGDVMGGTTNIGKIKMDW